MPFEPAETTYTYSSLTVGDPANCVGICTLWTPQERIARQLSPSEYGRIGNLYSRDGINHIIRNVLADPVVRQIVICGIDLTRSGEAFLRLGRDGVDDTCHIVGDPGLIDQELVPDGIAAFRAHVQLIDARGVTSGDEIRNILRDLEALPPFGPPRSYPTRAPSAQSFPSEGAGLALRGRRVADSWLLALGAVLRFGEEGHGEQGHVLAVPALSLTVAAEDPDAPRIPEFLGISERYLDEIAYPALLDAASPFPGATSEGERLQRSFGMDQIAAMADALRSSASTGRAIAAVWSPADDPTAAFPPGVVSLQATGLGGALALHAALREHDVFRSLPGTLFALRKLQQQIARQAGIPSLGPLVVSIGVAFIADDAWTDARDAVEQNRKRTTRRPRREERDPRGSFVVRLDGAEIVATHYAPSGVVLQEFRGSSAAAVGLAIRPFISQLDHALHIGGELAKAEAALRLPGLAFVQDQPLRPESSQPG